MRQNYEYLARIFCRRIRRHWLWNYPWALEFVCALVRRREKIHCLVAQVSQKLSVIVWLVPNYGGLRGMRKRGWYWEDVHVIRQHTQHCQHTTFTTSLNTQQTICTLYNVQCPMQAHMIWQLTHLVMSMLYKYLSIRLRCSVWHPKTLLFLLHTSVAWKWAGFVYYLALRAPWYMRQKEKFALEPLITCIVCRERMCMFVQADSFIWSTYNIHMHPPSAMYFQPPWYPYHFRQEQKFKESNKCSKSAIPRKA